jgi:adenylate cyclase
MAAQERKLATILAMDVVGYSSKMNKNEAGTVDQLRICQGIIEAVSKEKSGRIFNTAGDAFFVSPKLPIDNVTLCYPRDVPRQMIEEFRRGG